MPRTLQRLTLLAAAAVTIACDHATKEIARFTLMGTPERSYLGDTIRLGYSENAGGFLSFGAHWPVGLRIAFFTVGTGALLLALVVMALRSRWGGTSPLGLTLFAAGGLSNWIDRVLAGRVVDFLNVGVGSLRTGIFNVADVAIMAGVALVLAGELQARRERP